MTSRCRFPGPRLIIAKRTARRLSAQSTEHLYNSAASRPSLRFSDEEAPHGERCRTTTGEGPENQTSGIPDCSAITR